MARCASRCTSSGRTGRRPGAGWPRRCARGTPARSPGCPRCPGARRRRRRRPARRRSIRASRGRAARRAGSAARDPVRDPPAPRRGGIRPCRRRRRPACRGRRGRPVPGPHPGSPVRPSAASLARCAANASAAPLYRTKASGVPISGVGTMIVPSRKRAPRAVTRAATSRASSGVDEVRLTSVGPARPSGEVEHGVDGRRSSRQTTVNGDAATAAAGSARRRRRRPQRLGTGGGAVPDGDGWPGRAAPGRVPSPSRPGPGR